MNKKTIIFSATSGANFELAKELKSALLELNVESAIINLEDENFPLYTPKSHENSIPENVKGICEAMSTVNGFIMLGPEYNGSIPPVISNAIAWISVAGGDQWRASFNQKFAVVGTHSGGGGHKFCQAMKNQLEHLGTIVLPRHIAISSNKALNPKSANSILTQLKNLI